MRLALKVKEIINQKREGMYKNIIMLVCSIDMFCIHSTAILM